MNAAAVPTAVEDVQGDDRWLSMHKRFILEAKEKEPEVLFIGDSLVERLANTEIWEKLFVPMHCLNFGIGGDQTQHLLWRLQNGELENIAPKVIVLCIGTNNHGHSGEQVVEGIMAILQLITDKQPQATTITVSIPPRGQYQNPLREKFNQINSSLAVKIPTLPNAQFLNIDPSMFLSATEDEISARDMTDYLHFTRRGYQKWTEPILEEVQTTLKNFFTADVASAGDVADAADADE